MVLLVLQQCVFSVAQGQAIGPDIDFDPPVIDHEALQTGVPGETQVFTALIVDDRGIESVLFYYRTNSNTGFSTVPMQRLEQTDNFAVSIETQAGDRRIEYYIEALDTGGNRVLKGFPFYPLVRDMIAVPRIELPPPPAPVIEQPAGNKFVYIVLGALTVGLIAALSSGDNSAGSEPPGNNTVPLTVTVSPP